MEEKAAKSHKDEEKDKKDKNDNPPPAPSDKSQYNFTDPDSKIMPGSDKKSFIQGYNGQIVVDAKNQIIIANGLCTQTNDFNQLQPMVDEIESNIKELPDQLSADAGYYSDKNLKYLREKKIAPFIPPDKQKHRTNVKSPRGRIAPNMSTADRMRRWLKTKRGRECYALRKITVEPVFGQIKFGMGFTRFSLRGLGNAKGEWDLVCLCHNLLKLFRNQVSMG